METLPVSIEIRTSRGSRAVLLRPGRALKVGARAGFSDIVIEHVPGFEDHHVTLRLEGEIVTIEDAGTACGTLVNGRRIRRRELREGDSAQAAGVMLSRIAAVGPKTAAAPAKVARPPVEPIPPPLRTQTQATPPPVVVSPEPKAPPKAPAMQTPGNSGIAVSEWPAAELTTFKRSSGERRFAVLDLARDRRIHRALLLHDKKFEKLKYECLYEGKRAIQLMDRGPYLVELDDTSKMFDYLRREGWGNSWGIYLTSTQPFDGLLRHLRQFVTVSMPDGVAAYLRFYDPRVLRSLLSVCTHEQASELFAAVSAFIVESDRPTVAERFEFTVKPNPAFLPPLKTATRGLRGR